MILLIIGTLTLISAVCRISKICWRRHISAACAFLSIWFLAIPPSNIHGSRPAAIGEKKKTIGMFGQRQSRTAARPITGFRYLVAVHGHGDETRRQYYLHHFLKDQPQLNLYNPTVRAALFDVARFWLDMGVDGFRLDAVDFYMHDTRLQDNPMVAVTRSDQKEFSKQHHLHDMMLQYPTLDFLSSFRRVLEEYGGGRIAIGEVSSQPGRLQPHRTLHRAGISACGLHFANVARVCNPAIPYGRL